MQKYKDKLKSKKRKTLLFRLLLFCFVGIAGLIGLVYLLFFVRLLDVRSVTIEAPEESRTDISNAVDSWLNSGFWRLTKRSNTLFLSGDELTSKLIRQFPKLDSIKVTKKLPHSLVISASERKSAGVWCVSNNERCFYFDKNGVAFSEAQPSTGFLILNITDKRSRELKLGDKVIGDDWLSKIIKTKELLAKAEVSVSGFTIPADSFDEFQTKTVEGWEILLSNSTNIETQISALNTLLKEKLSPSQRAGLQYIDLRIQDRIYYK